jgi:hypothetical protein
MGNENAASFLQWKGSMPEQFAQLLNVCGGSETQAYSLWCEVVDEGRTQGMNSERERCLAHLELGDASGDMELAVEAIQSHATVASMADRYLAAATDGFRGRLTYNTLRSCRTRSTTL